MWCPRHLAGRLFAVVVHGDAEGAESVRRGLSDWLRSLELISAGHKAELDRYQALFDQPGGGATMPDERPVFGRGIGGT